VHNLCHWVEEENVSWATYSPEFNPYGLQLACVGTLGGGGFCEGKVVNI
jgi:hypothetical protein